MLQKPKALQLLALATFALLVTSSACTGEKAADNEPTPVLSRPPATAFPMPPLDARTKSGWVLNDGKRETLADYQGRVLVLDFYAT
ncbi:MAG: hypothetical protein LC776_16625, partial [Acidobacteria bacterium]|nr:hypothetical protein [Acidobacteriota bacterium]